MAVSLCGSMLSDDSGMLIRIPRHVSLSEGRSSLSLLMGRPRDERRSCNK